MVSQVHSQHVEENQEEMVPRSISEMAVLNVIESPFSTKQRKQKINWESILIARRLICILIFTFIPYPTLRIVIMLIFCWMMIFHTGYVSPYSSKAINKFEIGSLVILAILCLVNCLVAFSHETNTHLTGYLKAFPEIFVWIQAILLDIVPVLIFLTIFILVLLRSFFLVSKYICQRIKLVLIRFQGSNTEIDEHTYHLVGE